MSEEALVLRQDKDGIARLTLNRPAARNALSRPMIAACRPSSTASPRTRLSAW